MGGAIFSYRQEGAGDRIESSVTPSGVIIANYKQAGKGKTGNIGA